jgi:hypothetical protein
VLVTVFFALSFLSIAASVFAGQESPLRLRVHSASVTQRLVLLGYERAEAARAVEGLAPERLAKLAGSLGRPAAGFVLLSLLCFLFAIGAIWFTLLVI